jgi:hypothetical protein
MTPDGDQERMEDMKRMMSSILANQEIVIQAQKKLDERLMTVESFLSSEEFKDLKENVSVFKQIFHGDPNLGLSPLLDRVNRMWLNYDRLRWLVALALSLGVGGLVISWLTRQVQ